MKKVSEELSNKIVFNSGLSLLLPFVRSLCVKFWMNFKSHFMYTDAASLCIISVYKSGDIPGKTPLVSSLAYYTYVCIMAKHLCVCVCYAPNQTIKIIIHQLFCFLTSFSMDLLYSSSSLFLSHFNGICIHEMQLLNCRQRRYFPG
jgi:hypothetical protein